MKKIIICTALLFVPMGVAVAQQSIGYSNPQDFQQLLGYRLPDWGYSNLSLDFNSRGGMETTRNNNSETIQSHHNFILSPSYRLYRASESRIFSLSSNANVQYGNEYARDTNYKYRSNSVTSRINFDADFRQYLIAKFFLLISEDARFNYDYDYENNRQQNSSKRYRYHRDFDSESRLGFGFGRLRNVTPVIRAIRLNERYQAVSGGKRFNAQQIGAAADQFTRYQGYQSRYDRPEKYFWQGMDKAVDRQISALNSFDLFYLTDVLDENLGRRYEGWDVSVGGIFNYRNVLNRDELYPSTDGINRNISVYKYAGAFLGARWYKNLSLPHQLRFTVDASREYPLNNNNASRKWETDIRAEFSWLWNIADRYLLETQLADYFDVDKYQDDLMDSSVRWENSSVIGSNIVYFVENRLALQAGVSYSLSYRGDFESDNTFDIRTNDFTYTAGIKYYFSRRLY